MLEEGLAEETLSESLAWAGVRAVAMERLLLAVIEHGELPKLRAKAEQNRRGHRQEVGGPRGVAG